MIDLRTGSVSSIFSIYAAYWSEAGADSWNDSSEDSNEEDQIEVDAAVLVALTLVLSVVLLWVEATAALVFVVML